MEQWELIHGKWSYTKLAYILPAGCSNKDCQDSGITEKLVAAVSTRLDI